ncbi:tyrosine-type recombinase/integrase [Acrocarpospora macrocephala]|uniref:tyrosine-type recombinase/integrase n=1 Tax=Acrocarpospora macrocephala TaxID=150177 RepID=UPI0035A24289
MHDLRHTHVAWLLAAGIDLTTIARRIGHKNITTTADSYTHNKPTLEQLMAEAIDRHLGSQ